MKNKITLLIFVGLLALATTVSSFAENKSPTKPFDLRAFAGERFAAFAGSSARYRYLHWMRRPADPPLGDTSWFS